MNNIP